MNESILHCETCVLGKSHRSTYSSRISNKNVILFELIHSDVWGPSKEPIVSGMRYYVSFIDDCTRLTWVVLLKTKDEVFPAFQAFLSEVQTQYNAKVRILRSDNGRGGNMSIVSFSLSYKHMGLSTRKRVLTHLNKMGYPKGKIVIYLIWFVVFSLVPIVP